MWSCKHCKGVFEYTRTTDKANHTRHCSCNPNKHNTYIRGAQILRERIDKKHGAVKKFNVICEGCKRKFVVKERERKFPSKDKYFCTRTCANSVGGRAKRDKYGISQYVTVANMFYKRQCAVCGVTDVLDVHHIDENRKNFHPSNLIFLCPNDHARLHRNKDENVVRVIMGHGTAWGGRFFCKEDISRVRIPDAPPNYFKLKVEST